MVAPPRFDSASQTERLCALRPSIKYSTEMKTAGSWQVRYSIAIH
jgi:hypothetical protein